MIPRASIAGWRAQAPWISDEQVEQDLILSRILVDIFSDPVLVEKLAFRGGTALHKLFFNPPGRYSEDVDLVRTESGPIGKLIHLIRNKLDLWLGKPITKRNNGRFTLYYRFKATTVIAPTMRVKIEINTRESEALFELQQQKFIVENSWFTGEACIKTYLLEELLGTKLRALYQRKKGRDLFDLYLASQNFSKLDFDKTIRAFNFYLSKEKKQITRAQFEKNLYDKLLDKSFKEDVRLLLNQEVMMDEVGFNRAAKKVYCSFVKKLVGDPWRNQNKLLELIGCDS